MGKGFEDLKVWQEARILRKRIYKLTALLPEVERYVLFPQMRKAAVSVTNNIAEGHGSQSYKHNISYLNRSRGSVLELQDDLTTCEDQNYFKKEHLADLWQQSVKVAKLINGYVRYLRGRMKKKEKDRADRSPS